MVQEGIDFVINKVSQGTEPVSQSSALLSLQSPARGWQLAVHSGQLSITRGREGKFTSGHPAGLQVPAGWLPSANQGAVLQLARTLLMLASLQSQMAPSPWRFGPGYRVQTTVFVMAW